MLGTRILVAEATREAAGNHFTFRAGDVVRVQGRNRPEQVFELIAARAGLDPAGAHLIEAFERGLEAYRRRDWHLARRSFGSFIDLAPDDGPTAVFLRRLDRLEGRPPPEEGTAAGRARTARVDRQPERERRDTSLVDPVVIARAHGRRPLDERALVLMALGIECLVVPADGGMALLVSAEEAERAQDQLRLYDDENPPASAPPIRETAHGLDATLAYCSLMLFFFAADRQDAFGIDWSAAGAANAGLIRAGQWWRAVTALTLHAGLGHLMSNLAFGVLLGLLAAPVLGSGLAWLAMLIAGVLGNGINALFQPADHTAVGASTALFGAIGILAAYAWFVRPVPWRGGVRQFAPLAGGVMLLAFLGFGGKDVDMAAHVLGFLAGGAIGMGLAIGGSCIPREPIAQRAYAAIALAIVALAWAIALMA